MEYTLRTAFLYHWVPGSGEGGCGGSERQGWVCLMWQDSGKTEDLRAIERRRVL